MAGTNTSKKPKTTTSSTAGLSSVPSQYQAIVSAASAKYDIPVSLLAAQINQESGWQPSVVSSAGAEGIAQFMPGTAASNNVNPMDPSSAIPGMASLMESYYKEFGSWADALAAYNAGPGTVEQYGGVPPASFSGGQTTNYVADILAAAGNLASGKTTGSGSGGSGIAGGSGGSGSSGALTTALATQQSNGLLAKVGAFLLGGAILLVGMVVLFRNSQGPKDVEDAGKVAAVAAA